MTHLVKGIKSGHYIDREPYVLQSGFKYAKDWGFTVVLDVYNPYYYKPESPIWVAESDAEEAEAERPKPKLLESRPKAKAKAASSRATAEEVEERHEIASINPIQGMGLDFTGYMIFMEIEGPRAHPQCHHPLK